MTAIAPEVLRIDVGDVELGVVRWRGTPNAPLAVAVHDITANAWSWSVVARHLAGRVSLAAIDLRGRGTSHALHGPAGIRRHADDVAAVIRRLNASPSVVTGHGMGASVALAAAERHPDDIAAVVLVDGGAPLTVPPTGVSEGVLDDLLGAATSRLRRVWPDRVSYRAMWEEDPAFSGLLTPEIERYLLSDLVPCPGGFRSCVDEAAVRHDGDELLTDAEVRGLLDRHRNGVTIVRAAAGVDTSAPPLIGDDVVAGPGGHRWRTVAGTTHSSILIGEAGAAAVAEELLAAAH